MHTLFINLRKFTTQIYILLLLIGALVMIVICRAISSEPIVKIVEIQAEPIAQSVVWEMPQTNTEAENIARVLYGVKDYQLSTDAKKAIIEVIFNRVKCTYGEFGDTINEVCLKPHQWQGFVEDSNYLEEDYKLALSCINNKTGARVTPEGCYWLVISSEGVTVRTKFQGGNSWTVK